MRRFRHLFVIAAGLAVAGCITTGPYPSDLGGSKIVEPPVVNFRGRPVVQISFVSSADPSAETALLSDYRDFPLKQESFDDEGEGGSPTGVHKSDFKTASTNLKAMFVKNTFYAFHLAKFFKIKSGGKLAVVLNPLKLKHNSVEGYSYESFEKNMPPFDVEVNILSYVHPNTKPSNKGEIVTSFGEGFAPVISIRTDPQFNPAVGGAVALTAGLENTAVDMDGSGLRGQFIDMLNVRKYNAGNRYKVMTAKMRDARKESGPFEKGKYFRLPLGTYDLSKKRVPKEVIPPANLAGQDYNPGAYYAHEFYDAYYKVVMSVLSAVDNNKTVTAAQKRYWGYYEPGDVGGIMVGKSDRGKRRFLMGARRLEVQYLEDRDNNWMKAVLNTNDFGRNFNALRNAEQKARDEYTASQARAAVGFLLAMGGAVASSRSNSSYGYAGGAAMIGIGIGLVVDAMIKMDKVDVAFNTSFDSSYSSQKDYVFETSEGEKVTVRAKNYTDMREKLKERYYRQFRRERVVVPTS